MGNSHDTISVRRLVERLRRDRYCLEKHASDTYAKGWTHASEHVERVIVPWLVQQERVERGLAELRDAPAMDLRLRQALCQPEEWLL